MLQLGLEIPPLGLSCLDGPQDGLRRGAGGDGVREPLKFPGERGDPLGQDPPLLFVLLGSPAAPL